MIIYLGSKTLGEALPGLAEPFDQVIAAMDALRFVVATQTNALRSVRTTLEGAIDGFTDAIYAAKLAIRTAALSELLGRLAALEAQIDMLQGMIDPARFLSQLQAALTQVAANIAALTPLGAFGDQLNAAMSALSTVRAQIAAFDAVLDQIDVVVEQLTGSARVVTSAIGDITAALDSAVAAAGNAINATATIRNHLLAAGIHVFWYRGQLSQLGAEIDAAAEAHTGIPGAATVHVPILIVSDGNPAGIAGISAVFAAPP